MESNYEIVDSPRYASFVTEEDAACVDEALGRIGGIDELRQLVADNTQTLSVGEQAFKAVIYRPKNDHDETKGVIVGPEYANGSRHMPGFARAIATHAIAGGRGTLMIPLVSALGEKNTNFSRSERRRLHHGDDGPMLDRYETLHDFAGQPQDLALLGTSQAGATVLAYGASNRSPDAVAAAVIETPNVQNRTNQQIIWDFLKCGNQEQVLGFLMNSFGDAGQSQLAQELASEYSSKNNAIYIAGMVKRDNLAFLGLMRRDTAAAQVLEIIQRKGAVTQVWSGKTDVSPAPRNRVIADTVGAKSAAPERYAAVEVEDAWHALTNDLVLGASAVKNSIQLRTA